MEFKQEITIKKTIKEKVYKRKNREAIRKHKRDYYQRCKEKIMGFKIQFTNPQISVKRFCIEI